jgi:peptidoglycan/LPS O-acetylase OafA/YrhL
MPTLLLVTLIVLFFYSKFMGVSANFEGFYKWIIPGAIFEDEFSPLLYGHYWSLRNEWLFYLILFVVALLRLHSSHALMVLSLTLFALAIFDPTFSMILSGVIAGVLQRFGYLKKIDKSYTALILLAFIVYLYFAPFEGIPNVVRYLIRWLIIFAIGVILIEKKIRLFAEYRVLKLFSYSGTPAYSLYLSHGFALFITYVFASNYAYIYKLPFKIPLEYILLPATIIWLCLGWFIYWLFEKPYWKFREHFK